MSKTLELLGSIQRFLTWLRKEADLNDKGDQGTAIEMSQALDADIELFIHERIERENDGERRG